MNVQPINIHVTQMHVAGTPKARMNAFVMAPFGSETGLIVIIMIHVGTIHAQKTISALRKMIFIKMSQTYGS